jgi:Pre-mRNA splicing factor PRP21 like protein
VKESEADEARAERERERLAMMLIDWHDFAVVRTIEFDDTEDLMALGRPVAKEMVIQMNKTGEIPGAQPLARCCYVTAARCCHSCL